MSINKQENPAATIAELVSVSSDKTRLDNTDESGRFFKAQEVSAINTETDGNQTQINIFERLRAANMLVTGSQLDASFFDEYRRIKRPLLSNAFGKTAELTKKGNLILITSSIQGEGKSYSAINLALSIAHERDHTVLLVDCDVAHHGSSGLLGIVDKPGLIELLESDDLDISDVILRTDIPKLCLISAGRQHEYVTELLASKRMAELVGELGARYEDRVIIFDGPPVLPTPQTQVLTGLVGQIAFVVEAGKTPQVVVEEALALIPEGHATGLLMNKSEGLSGRSSYYYGYYGSNNKS